MKKTRTYTAQLKNAARRDIVPAHIACVYTLWHTAQLKNAACVTPLKKDAHMLQYPRTFDAHMHRTSEKDAHMHRTSEKDAHMHIATKKRRTPRHSTRAYFLLLHAMAHSTTEKDAHTRHNTRQSHPTARTYCLPLHAMAHSTTEKDAACTIPANYIPLPAHISCFYTLWHTAQLNKTPHAAPSPPMTSHHAYCS